MRRLAFAAAVCGTLVIAACSDQNTSPTEPSVPPPSATFGTTCKQRYLIRDVIPFIAPAFSDKRLKAEALVRVGAIALLWDFCQDGLARRAAFKTLSWIDTFTHTQARDDLKAAILAAFGGAEFPGDYVAGFYETGTTGDQYFTTPSGRATLKLGPCAFNKRTLITIRRLPDGFRLSGYPADLQRSPFWDYDATNSSTDNTFATHQVGSCTPPDGPPDGTLAFCYSGGFEGQNQYPPPGARIGHNPVGGGFEFLEEPDGFPPDLADRLTDCVPSELLRTGSSGGLSGFGNVAWSSAGHYLAQLARTLFLPAPLRAATVGGRGPIAGIPPSLSPFGIVLPNCQPYGGYYTAFCLPE